MEKIAAEKQDKKIPQLSAEQKIEVLTVSRKVALLQLSRVNLDKQIEQTDKDMSTLLMRFAGELEIDPTKYFIELDTLEIKELPKK